MPDQTRDALRRLVETLRRAGDPATPVSAPPPASAPKTAPPSVKPGDRRADTEPKRARP